MADASVEQVRRFNRVVTERVGALNDRFLGRSRPLGEARLLWEIGLGGCEVRLLRSRLGTAGVSQGLCKAGANGASCLQHKKRRSIVSQVALICTAPAASRQASRRPL